MIPILYSTITEGIVPTDYGVGALVDCLSCKAKEERNSIYELEMEYSASGIHADQITPGAFIKAKANFTDPPQLFQIYKVGKNINGRFTINAQHVSYLLNGKVITQGSANNIVSAVQTLLQGAAGNFTLETSKNTVANFTITEPSSVRSWFGGKQGSLLDVYGGGEWHYNNFVAKLWQNRGEDRHVTIRYGKNLTELSQEIDMSNLVSGVIPFCKDADGNITVGSEVSTGLLGFSKTVAVDFSQDVDPESSTPLTSQLSTLATAYVSKNNFTSMLTNITLDFVQLQGVTERIDLCDTVHIYFEPLGISASMKCIATVWDVLAERYIETTFGDPKASIADTIAETTAAVNEIASIAENKKRVFVTQPVPPYDIGDLWVDDGTIYYCVEGKKETVTGEASGSIATFDTFLKNDLIECKADIMGSQDLNGYSKPWAAGCGTNIWDEEWESGGFQGTDGQPYVDPNRIRSKNYIPIQPNTSYFCYHAENNMYVFFYDENHNYLTHNAFNNTTFTTYSNYRYCRFHIGSYANPVTTYNHNIAINYPSTVTTYSPYANICPLTAYTEANVSRSGKNLFINNKVSSSSGGVTYTTNDDGTIDLTGTATSTIFIAPMGSTGVFYPSGTYTMTKSGNSGIQMLLRENDISGNDAIRATTTDVTRTITSGKYACLIRIASGTVTDGITLYPQLEVGDSASTYEPYERETYNLDIRINKGVNIWDEEWEEGWLSSSDGTPSPNNSTIRSKNFCPIEPDTTYYACLAGHSADQYWFAVYLYDEDKVFTHRIWSTNLSFTTTANDKYFKITTNTGTPNYGNTYTNDISINYPSTDVFYHPHDGDPVYKGGLDVLTGVLTVTHKVVDLGSLNWDYSSGVFINYTSQGDLDTKERGGDCACEIYEKCGVSSAVNMPDGSVQIMGGASASNIWIKDSRYSSGATFKTAMDGIKLAYELATPETYNLTPQDIQTIIGKNVVFADTGDVDVTYYVQGFAFDDWQLATNFVDESDLEASINTATNILTGGVGGNVVINYKDMTVDGVVVQVPYEILILCDADTLDEALQIWRWNSGGLGYSYQGYDGPYETAITVDENGRGQINADFITTGNINALDVMIQNLTATMFTGNTIVLGGSEDCKLIVQDTSNPPKELIRINTNGMECFGEAVGGHIPSVVFDKSGVTGYSDSSDKENSKIFWTHADQFLMSNSVVENEASFGGKIRFVPLNNGTNNGIAIVAVK